MTISKTDNVGETLDRYPQLAEFFFDIGMHCLGCPSARGESIEDACGVHGVDCDAFLEKLNGAIG